MSFRIYIDESGTHEQDNGWLVIGSLFVPDHGALHSALCRVKDDLNYFNKSPKRNARYRETHLARFRGPADLAIANGWISEFVRSSAYYRAVAIDWSIWDGRFFGDPFEADALKKRRAYKKWTEMLLHHEFKSPTFGAQIANAELFLDRLRAVARYEVLEELEDRFNRNYEGTRPYVSKFAHTDSWRDANQCLQLCDLFTGCVRQALVPGMTTRDAKKGALDSLQAGLAPFGIQTLEASFWQGYAAQTLSKHFPRFNVWCWQPDKALNRERRKPRNR